jgi:hypothetical protein
VASLPRDPAAPEPVLQSAAVTPPAAPRSVTSPPHEPPPPRAAAEPALQSAAVTPPAALGSVTSLPQEQPPLRDVGLHLGSTAFTNLAAETQRTRRNILERFREEHGDKRIVLIALRAVIAFAIDAGIRADDDPTLGIKRPKIKTEGYRTWTEDDIAAFEATHPIGTLPRLALALLLYTGQRRADVVRMGLQHVRGDLISVRQRSIRSTWRGQQ